MKQAIHTFVIFPLSCFILLSTGCGTLWTSKAQYVGVGRMMERGDFAAAKTQIENSRLQYYPKKDRALYFLDLGLLQHYLGDYRASNQSLEAAEQAMDDAFVKSVTRGVSSLLLNDNLLEYAGEDYENVYVNVFKALNYLALSEFDGAFVEIRRIDEKLKVLESRTWKIAQNYEQANQTDQPFKPGKNRFQNSALSRWLSLLIYRAEGRLDEAAIDLKKIDEARAMQPSLYNFGAPDLSSALTKPPAGTVRVSFLSLIGQAPEKRADTFWAHTQLNQIFIGTSREQTSGGQQLSGLNVIPWPGIEPGYTFKFQLPRIEKRGTRVSSVGVKIEGQPQLWLSQIESLENAAEAAFEIRKPLIYLKTVSRAVTKGIAAAQAQRAAAAKWGETQGLIAGLLAGFGISTTENADLRISRFFPAQAYVVETDLTPGTHRIEFEYYAAGGILLHVTEATVHVDTTGLNLVKSFYLN